MQLAICVIHKVVFSWYIFSPVKPIDESLANGTTSKNKSTCLSRQKQRHANTSFSSRTMLSLIPISFLQLDVQTNSKVFSIRC
jgi:hypothetical protein